MLFSDGFDATVLVRVIPPLREIVLLLLLLSGVGGMVTCRPCAPMACEDAFVSLLILQVCFWSLDQYAGEFSGSQVVLSLGFWFQYLQYWQLVFLYRYCVQREVDSHDYTEDPRNPVELFDCNAVYLTDSQIGQVYVPPVRVGYEGKDSELGTCKGCFRRRFGA